ncbi:MAG: mechanosensitive ion channel [Gammaproteobacteria bacterium]|nr:mechanosensitive ion channel [Gammaproteobacteria bacterium]
MTSPRALLLLLFFALLSPLLPAEETPLQSEIDLVSSRLDALESSDESSKNRQQRSALQQLLETLRQQQAAVVKSEALNQLLHSYSTTLRRQQQAREEQEQLQAASPAPHDREETIEQALILKNAALLKLKSRKSLHEQELNTLKGRPEAIRNELETIQNRIKQEQELPPDEGETALPSELAKALQEALRKELTQKIQLLNLEQLANPHQLEISRNQILTVSNEIALLEEEIENYRSRLQQLRSEESRRSLEKSRILSEEDGEQSILIQRLAARNEDLAQALSGESAESHNSSETEQEVSSRLTLVNKNYQFFQQQLTFKSQNSFLGEQVRLLLATIPERASVYETLTRLEQTRMKSLLYEQKLSEMEDHHSYLQQIIDEEGVTTTVRSPEWLKTAQPLLTIQRDLTNRLLQTTQSHTEILSRLLSVQNRFNEQRYLFLRLLRENLLWTASTRPLSNSWLTQLPGEFARILTPKHAQQLQEISARLTPMPLLPWFILYLFALYLVHRTLTPYYRALVNRALSRKGKVNQDKFSYPLRMLILPLLLVAPTPLFLEICSRLLSHQSDSEAILALAQGIHWAAYLLFATALLRQLGAPRGLFLGQFGWNSSTVTPVIELSNRYRPLLILLTTLYLACDQFQSEAVRNGPGRLFFLLAIVTALAIAANWFRLRGRFHQGRPRQPYCWWRSLRFWGGFLVAAEVILLIMAATGYYYGAATLQRLFVESIAYLTLLAIAAALVNRWILISEREIAYQRAMLRRNEQLQLRANEKSATSSSSGEVVSEMSPDLSLDITEISLQSRTLINIISLLLTLSGLYFIWSDMLPAVSFLDNITLWNSVVTDSNGIEEIHSISLKLALLALITLVVALIASRNLPGVLELLILRRIQLAPGTGYAITTLLRYSVIFTGVIIALNLLGVQWERLQWLVAAFSVGLGFGLQEIFANFVSGLIILFEKPIRIGDTVTIGQLTGTVTRIQIRATTITDWDRKEVIIPNKSFITDQLVNWSLSDNISRQVIKVGIAYGSDTLLAQQLLLQIAQNHPLVLTEPAPSAFFLGFGNSTLDFELRIYLNGIDQVLSILHDIHSGINQIFQQHGITIAFPQLDIHLQSKTER